MRERSTCLKNFFIDNLGRSRNQMQQAGVYITIDLEETLNLMDKQDTSYRMLKREEDIFKNICIQINQCFNQMKKILEPEDYEMINQNKRKTLEHMDQLDSKSQR